MTSFNRVLLIGNLTRDPELRFTPLGAPVCEFTVAVETIRLDEGEPVEGADYIPVNVWGNSGQACHDRLRKGSLVHLEGHLKQQRWADRKTRRPHARIVVIANKLLFLARLKKVQEHAPFSLAQPLSLPADDPESPPVVASQAHPPSTSFRPPSSQSQSRSARG